MNDLNKLDVDLVLPLKVRQSYAALTPEQRSYCELVVDSRSPRQAYLESHGTTNVHKSTLFKLQHNADVTAYIAFLLEAVCSHITIHSHLNNLSDIAFDKETPPIVRVNASKAYLQSVQSNPLIHIETGSGTTITMNIPLMNSNAVELDRRASAIECDLLGIDED